MKKIIISGANFNNKGAQSMLFIVVDEMRKRFPNCDIYFLSSEKLDLRDYSFNQLYFSVETSKILNRNFSSLLLLCTRYIKEFIKKIAVKKYKIHDPLYTIKQLKSCDFIIDISGYQLGDKWSLDLNYLFLNVIKFSKRFSIPIYIMPQSFGPFDYRNLNITEKNKLLNDIQHAMKYPRVVFARENSALKALNQLGVDQVILSPDLVLQNSGINKNNIYVKHPKTVLPKIQLESVGIVPNAQCFKFGDHQIIMNLYQTLINRLLLMDKKVYLIRHSGEDGAICQEIKSIFFDNEDVIFLDIDLSCLEYDELVKQFDLIVSSRYHGAVHALRNLAGLINISS